MTLATDLRGRGWMVLLTISLVSAGLTTLTGPADWVRDLLYVGVTGGSAAAAVLAVRRATLPAGMERAWKLVASALVVQVAADVLWTTVVRNGTGSVPAVVDVVSIVPTVLFFAAAYLLVRTRRGRPRDHLALYDTAVVSGAMSAAMWVFVLEPGFNAAASLSMVGFDLVYPVLGLLLLVMIARMLIAEWPLSPSLQLLLVGLVTIAGAHTGYVLQTRTGTYVEWGAIDAAYLLAFGIMGAAALHPSLGQATPETENRPRLGRVRLAALTVGAITPLLLLPARLESMSAVLLLSSCATILFMVVIIRSWSLVRMVEGLTRERGARRFSAMVRNSGDAIVVTDQDGVITSAGVTLGRTWCVSPGGREGHIDDWVIAADRQAFALFREQLVDLPESESARVNVRVSTPTGEGHAEIVGSNLLGQHEVEGVVLTIRDTTDRVALEQQLRWEAERDGLTGLVNRATFHNAVERELRQADVATPTLMLLDIDDFKLINDERGHGIGDRVLVEFAQRLDALMPPHAVAGRIGGDEFAVLIPDASNVASVANLAARISKNVAVPTRADDDVLTVTASIGIAVAGTDSDIESIFRETDTALYAAKAAGRGLIRRYTDALARVEADNAELRDGLAGAIEDGEFEVRFRPAVDLRTDRLMMVEASIVWQHPRRGELGVDVFGPVAQATGHQASIDTLMLRESCRIVGSLDTDLAVALEVSAGQLHTPLFIAEVHHALGDGGLPASSLVVAVDEEAMTDVVVRRRLERVRREGVRVAVSRFGSGPAGLALLHEGLVDLLLLDPQFVRSGTIGPVAESVLHLALALDIPTVVDGVDARTLLQRLRSSVATAVSGRAVGRPLTAEQLRARMGPRPTTADMSV